jgi:hypothetical protein
MAGKSLLDPPDVNNVIANADDQGCRFLLIRKAKSCPRSGRLARMK